MKHAVRRLERLSEDKYTRAEIEAHAKQQRDQWAREDYRWDEGWKKGMEKGMDTEREKIALNLLRTGVDTATISECTSLTQEAIRALQKKM